MKKIALVDFRRQYGGANRRNYLIGQLATELRILRMQKIEFRAYMFGSILNTKKRCPGDVDILLAMARPINFARWRQTTSSRDVHIVSSDRAYFKVKLHPFGPNEMVDKFNRDTRNNRARISLVERKLVELV